MNSQDSEDSEKSGNISEKLGYHSECTIRSKYTVFLGFQSTIPSNNGQSSEEMLIQI